MDHYQDYLKKSKRFANLTTTGKSHAVQVVGAVRCGKADKAERAAEVLVTARTTSPR
ncbi:hypothetical protein DPMN_167121 [Dreissena polymorpha]|uniref:Uncharacterized protein n=1 Tax=Dreissena polymorpha TaxID=45954 RepID=A0A9D4F3B1_DREPO|nr:hypothetical protein DPMN_167121 [Dreissena polymorpha]